MNGTYEQKAQGNTLKNDRTVESRENINGEVYQSIS
jgi:hypothetical protein